MSSKLIILHGSKFKFRTDSVWLDWKQEKNNSFTNKQVAIICLHNTEDQMDVIHPLTDFIFRNWRYSSYNTQRKHALNITTFLNFLLEKHKKYGISSLMDLEISHVELYLNFLTESGKARESVKGVERTLSLLYRFLAKHDCLPKVAPSCFTSYTNLDGKEILVSPFKNVIFPVKTKSAREHTFPLKYLPILFEIACLFAKPIALGLYFQIFGGLRVGEVVNIKRSQIKHGVTGDSVLLNVIENSFRTDLKDLNGSNYVKKLRSQHLVIVKEWYEPLYKDHLELYACKDASGALFVNRDGKAMSAKSYRQYFDKVKKLFISNLRKSSDINDKLLAYHLNISKWSTHIGRGIFSNMLAEYAQNPYDIAVPRGDTSLLSSLSYLQKTSRFRGKLEERFNQMHVNYIPRLIEEQKNED